MASNDEYQQRRSFEEGVKTFVLSNGWEFFGSVLKIGTVKIKGVEYFAGIDSYNPDEKSKSTSGENLKTK